MGRIYEITDSKMLLAEFRGITSWMIENENTVRNANMYQIMECMLARNKLHIGPNLGRIKDLNHEIEVMEIWRKQSLWEFHLYVPESDKLYEKVRKGLIAQDENEMEFICKCQSVAFYINNRRIRGNCDMLAFAPTQTANSEPQYMHDNESELLSLARGYENASEEVKQCSYPLVNWIINNSIYKDKITLSEPNTAEESHGYGGRR